MNGLPPAHHHHHPITHRTSLTSLCLFCANANRERSGGGNTNAHTQTDFASAAHKAFGMEVLLFGDHKRFGCSLQRRTTHICIRFKRLSPSRLAWFIPSSFLHPAHCFLSAAIFSCFSAAAASSTALLLGAGAGVGAGSAEAGALGTCGGATCACAACSVAIAAAKSAADG